MASQVSPQEGHLRLWPESAPLQRHAETVARAKRDLSVRFDPVSWRYTQAIGAGDGREHQARLRHGKVPTNIDA